MSMKLALFWGVLIVFLSTAAVLLPCVVRGRRMSKRRRAWVEAVLIASATAVIYQFYNLDIADRPIKAVHFELVNPATIGTAADPQLIELTPCTDHLALSPDGGDMPIAFAGVLKNFKKGNRNRCNVRVDVEVDDPSLDMSNVGSAAIYGNTDDWRARPLLKKVQGQIDKFMPDAKGNIGVICYLNMFPKMFVHPGNYVLKVHFLDLDGRTFDDWEQPITILPGEPQVSLSH